MSSPDTPVPSRLSPAHLHGVGMKLGMELERGKEGFTSLLMCCPRQPCPKHP